MADTEREAKDVEETTEQEQTQDTAEPAQKAEEPAQKAEELIMTPEDFFNKIKSDNVEKLYVRDGEDCEWRTIEVVQTHSKEFKFFTADMRWLTVDPFNMVFEKPDGFVAPPPKRERANSMGAITSSTVSFQPGATYVGRTRRHRWLAPAKPDHGFAGLKNQGATCYLNSLLQTLFMTLGLRQAIFQWRYNPDTDPADKDKCMTLVLQELFAFLQYGKQASASTERLTKSFGWSQGDVFQQHDVMEMAQVILDFMREHTHDENLSGIVSNFRCKISDYIECMETNIKRERNDELLGITLAIDSPEVNSVDDAFRKYLEFEVMDGDNQVMNESLGRKTDHKKGIAFTQFGKYLAVQLGRWTLDYTTFQRKKVNKVIQFNTEIDMSPYIDTQEPMMYELYSMMIHRGGAYGGHYFAYIKDFKTGNWFEFNDSTVTLISPEEFAKMMNVEEEQQTAESDVVPSAPSAASGYSRGRTSPFTGAYMLMYRRMHPENLMEVPNDCIDAELRESIEEADKSWEEKRQDFYLYTQYGDSKKTVKLHVDKTLEEQLDVLLKEFEIDENTRREDIRLCSEHRGLKAKPFEVLDKSFKELGIQDDDHVFLEIKQPDEVFEEYKADMRKFELVSLNLESMQLEYQDLEVSKDGTCRDLRAKVAEIMEIEPKQCKLYFKYGSKDSHDQLEACDYDQLEIQSSAFNSVEQVWVDKADESFDLEQDFPIYAFFENMKHTRTFKYNRLDNIDEASESLTIDDRVTIGKLREMLGEALGVDPMSFILRKPGGELKNPDELLSDVNMFPKTFTLIPGTPMIQGMYRVNILLDSGDPDDDERFEPITNNFVIFETWTRQEFYNNLLQELSEPDKESQFPPFNLMRIRRKSKDDLTDFVPTEGTMKDLPGLCDGYEIVIQKLEQEETLNKKDLILQFGRFKPETGQVVRPLRDFVVPRSTTYDELKALIMEEIGDEIPPQHLVYQKTKTLRNTMFIVWGTNRGTSQLHRLIWRSGYYCLYKDAREVDPENGGEEDLAGAGESSIVRTARRYQARERGIKIFTAQEQEERQKARSRNNSMDDEKQMEPGVMIGPSINPNPGPVIRERGNSV